MSVAYGLAGFVNVPPPVITGFGPPPASFVGLLGQSYFDKSTNPFTEYVYDGSGWALGGASGANEFDANTGKAIPAGGIINILGTSGVTTSAAGNTITITSDAGGFPITPFVVGPVGKAGYQTVQAAINAANTAGGGMVYVQPGTYTENLTFFDKIQLVSVEYINAPQTTIVGIHTPPTTGAIALRGLVLQSATHIFSSVAAGSCTISMLECTFKITNGYIFNLPNWTGNGFNINDCGELSTNNGVINNSGGAAIFTNNCQVGAGTGNTFTTNGDVRLDLTFLGCPANISGGNIFVNFALFNNTITVSGNAAGTFLLVNSFPTALPCFSITSSNPITIGNSVLTTSNNPAITGTGTVQLNEVTFGDNTNLAGTLTVTYGTNTLGPTRITGNLTFTTPGNKIISSSVGTVAAAGANSFGTVTLVGGTATVATTAIGVNSFVVLWRQSIGATGAAALGFLSCGTITGATSFVINALQPADATALQASDVSIVGWMIIN